MEKQGKRRNIDRRSFIKYSLGAGGDFCSAQVLQGCFDKPVRQAQVKEFK
jgi:hypothetical protein